jgi:uncharacterized NAD(P)/FAD-binding protein YdhS
MLIRYKKIKIFSMEGQQTVISIVGGGASSVIILDKIIDQALGHKVLVRIFEGSDKPIGSGYAFDTHQSETNLTNSPIDYVTIKGEQDEAHFLKWLKANYDSWAPSFPEIAKDIDNLTLSGSFLPRKLGGMYLEASYKELRDRCKVEEVRGQVVDIKVDGS